MLSLLDPAVLFFLVGLFAGLVRSNLDIPPAISRFLALYLLMALGLKGGLSLAETGFTFEVMTILGLAILLAMLTPVFGFLLLRRVTQPFNAIAIAATYGSVSAVTFITANQFLDRLGVEHGGYMAAAMAIMESPAIIFAVLMANSCARVVSVVPRALKPRRTRGGSDRPCTSPSPMVHSCCCSRALVIGYYMGPEGAAAMKPLLGRPL